ncbi:MAG: Hpt domain-containing protein [Planctomycetota bacterium]
MTQISIPDADPAFQKLIELFVEGLATRAEALEHARLAGDRIALRSLAHQLKGAAGGYGFVELGVLAGIVQQDCQDNVGHEKLAVSVKALVTACQDAANAEFV